MRTFARKCCQIVVCTMATVKALVYESDRRKDGTYNVKMRLTHKRRTLKISTSLYVDKSQITKGLKFKDARVRDMTDDIVRRWRGFITELGFRADSMDVRELAEYIKVKERGSDDFRLDFIDYGRSILDRWPKTTSCNYSRALNSFERIVGHMDINEITPAVLQRYERATLETAPKGGGLAYLQRLKAIYTLAQKEFNNPYAGEVKIPHSPFDYFKATIKVEEAEKRAIEMEYIQKMIDLELDEPHERQTRDLWLISFALAGVNMMDFTTWTHKNLKGDIISYRRRKIKRIGARADTQIRIEPQIVPLINRYMTKKGDLLFKLRFNPSSYYSYRFLPIIAQKIGLEGILHQYSARHSWATIARNQCKLEGYTVNDALVHVTPEMKMTDVYIKKDYSHIWEANKKVLDLFDWSNLMKEERED